MSELERFKNIVAKLRDPETGCPWDKVQTMMSLRRYLIEEAGEWFVIVNDAHVTQCFDEETGIEQMHHGMLGTAGIDIDRHPLLELFLAEGLFVIVRIAVAEEIPG